MWVPKMCRHALQRPRYAWQRLWPTSTWFCKILRVPYRRETPPPTCCLISYETKEVVYHQASRYETWWYITLSVSQFIRQQVRGFLFDVGLLGPCKSMLRSAALLLWVPKMCRYALQCPRHAWQRLWPTSACFLQGLRSLISKKNSPLAAL